MFDLNDRASSSSPITDRPRRRITLRARSPFERLADKARAAKTIAPWMLDRLGEPDARAYSDLDIVRARKNLKRRIVQREPILRVRDPKRLTQASWTGAQQPFVGDAAPPAHDSKAVRGGERADQHRAGHARRSGRHRHSPAGRT